MKAVLAKGVISRVIVNRCRGAGDRIAKHNLGDVDAVKAGGPRMVLGFTNVVESVLVVV